MRTNYYLHSQDPCEHCGRSYPELHIGKSSAGWVFALHVGDNTGCYGLEDWKKKFQAEGAKIYDEYGKPVAVEDMLSIITERKGKGNFPTGFHFDNGSEDGPNGLARTKWIQGGRMTAHGEGTWDCFGGEFS